jgi:hypothetical protein
LMIFLQKLLKRKCVPSRLTDCVQITQTVIDFLIAGRLPPRNDLIEGMAELSSA